VEIRAGTGGEEAALFAADLFRMYNRYADGQSWKVEVMDTSPSERGGFKEIVFSVQGEDVYKNCVTKSACIVFSACRNRGAGTHPYFNGDRGGVARSQGSRCADQAGRIGDTSAAPAAPWSGREHDGLRRPNPPQTQRPHRALRRRAVATQEQDKAMRVLRSRLLARKQEEEQAKLTATRRSQIGTADRSEKSAPTTSPRTVLPTIVLISPYKICLRSWTESWMIWSMR